MGDDMLQDSLTAIGVLLTFVVIGLMIWQIILTYDSKYSSSQSNEKLSEISGKLEELAPEEPILEVSGFKSQYNMSGKDLELFCQSAFECKPEHYKEEWDKDYLKIPVTIANKGKRANNVVVDFYCDGIEIYKVVNKRECNMKMNSVLSNSGTIEMPEIDGLDRCNFDIVYENPENKTFTCKFTYLSDEIIKTSTELTFE